MKRIIPFFIVLLVLSSMPPQVLAVGTDTWQVLAKATADECFIGVGDSANAYPFDPLEDICGGQEKRNEAYVWGMAKSGDNVFFGTGANIHCLVIQGYLGQNNPILTEDYVCEASADAWRDFRPPSMYIYNPFTGLTNLFDLNTPQTIAPELYANAQLLRQGTTGIRSAGAHPSGIVFLAGPGISRGTVNLFAFDGNTGELLGISVQRNYSNIRKWRMGSDGNLYLGFGGGEGGVGGGAVMKWVGDPDAILNQGSTATLFDFEKVGEGMDGDAAELVEHEGRLYVTTWPGSGGDAGLWMSPPLPLSNENINGWQKLWKATQYDPDRVTAMTYGGGALASFDGWLYWGTMHVPLTSASAHARVYGSPQSDEEYMDMILGTWRAISIFRGRGFDTGTPEIQLLYGGSPQTSRPGYFRAYINGSWQTVQNRMGLTPLYGRGGFNNQYNNYCWTMEVYHGSLYVGTMDHSYLLKDTGDLMENPISSLMMLIYFGQTNYGADLFRFDSTSQAAVAVNQNGMNNPTTYGIRTLITDGPALYLGMANPMNLNPQGGWELISLTSTRTKVPNVVGLNMAEALKNLQEADIVCNPANITWRCSTTVPEGQVISQNVSPGRIVSPGNTVNLTVSFGACEVPDYIGQSEIAARELIENKGYVVGEITHECSSTEIPAGEVMAQSPVVGASAQPGTAINLVISNGPCASVPDVVEMEQSAAETALQDEGFTVGEVTRQCSDVAEGVVIEQTPPAGTQAGPGTPVSLTVSSGEPCPVVAPGDLDGDGQVCSKDLLILRRSMNKAVQPGDPMDLNDDGKITFTDYMLLRDMCTLPNCVCGN